MASPSRSDLDNTPSTHLVLSLCRNNLDWHRACGELIDNAFDAGATSVAISIEKRRGVETFSIADNGVGCDDLRSFVRLGDHRGKASTRLGQYGIGAKEAMLWIGQEPPRINVTSVHGGKEHRLTYDFAAVYKSGSWAIDPDSLQTEDATPGECGTIVRVQSPRLRQLPHGAAWDGFVARLGYLYAPAIKRGRQITFARNGEVPQPIARYELPPLEPGFVDAIVDVGGKQARVHVGIVAEGASNPRPGITYTYGFRVIVAAGGYGCGPFDYTRIAGVVDLGAGWLLTKNKDNISQHADELYAAVLAICGDVLRRAEVKGQRVESAAFENAVDRLFNDMVFGQADAKAQRGKGSEHGTKEPTGRGGKHGRAEKTQPGDRFPRVSRGALRVTYNDDQTGRLGEYSPPGMVILNTRHPAIGLCRAQKNELATALAAASLFSAQALTGEQLVFKRIITDAGGPADRFVSMLSEILRGARVDGKALEPPAADRPAAGDAE